MLSQVACLARGTTCDTETCCVVAELVELARSPARGGGSRRCYRLSGHSRQGGQDLAEHKNKASVDGKRKTVHGQDKGGNEPPCSPKSFSAIGYCWLENGIV